LLVNAATRGAVKGLGKGEKPGVSASRLTCSKIPCCFARRDCIENPHLGVQRCGVLPLAPHAVHRDIKRVPLSDNAHEIPACSMVSSCRERGFHREEDTNRFRFSSSFLCALATVEPVISSQQSVETSTTSLTTRVVPPVERSVVVTRSLGEPPKLVLRSCAAVGGRRTACHVPPLI
jgi:hypothetical protein